jgi:GxxExxY protein
MIILNLKKYIEVIRFNDLTIELRNKICLSMELLQKELTDQIIRAFYAVYNELGYGFLEKVYERALFIELSDMGVSSATQQQIKVFYKARDVGDYFADLMVKNAVIVEIKTVDELNEDHKKQLQNYLKATSIEVGLLLNFGPKPKVVRRIFTNDLK